jgi:hypothetical protein
MKKSENGILKIENIVASGSVAEAIDLEDHTMLRVKTFISNPIVHCESHFKRHIHKIPHIFLKSRSAGKNRVEVSLVTMDENRGNALVPCQSLISKVNS